MTTENVTVKYTAKQLLANFFLFTIIVLGYELHEFHVRWARFQLSRSRSLVLAPRGHGKSTILTIAYLIWRIVQNPNIRILIVSNAATAAEKFLESIKDHFEKNELLRTLYGDFVGKKWNTGSITVAKRTKVGIKEPTVSTVGVYGSIVSGHFDLIMVDDLVDFENALKKESRDKMWNWLWTVLMPTADGEIHFIGTRYNDDDLYGRAIRKESTMTSQRGQIEGENEGFLADCWIRDRALKNKDGDKYTPDGKLFPVDYAHPENLVALWPEKKGCSVPELLETRRQDSIIFEMQYQNNSELARERIFKKHYFTGRYKMLPERCMIFGGSDLAISEKTSADYFVIVILAIDTQKNVYIIDLWRDKISAPKQFEAFKAEYNKHKFIAMGVESVAYQEAMTQFLQENTAVPAKPVKVHKDKVIRAHSVLGMFENGKVFWPEGMDITDIVEEFCMFPEGVHDDMVDAVVMAINIAISTSSFAFSFA